MLPVLIFKDSEDDVRLASALRCGASCILSRDRDHCPAGVLPALSPRDFLASRT
ncbi:MAG: hypothetical protein II839_12250 [Kiritimatiellae bacterium]|nr:hypothetical protein [Kiritimatiellia bacterium]